MENCKYNTIDEFINSTLTVAKNEVKISDYDRADNEKYTVGFGSSQVLINIYTEDGFYKIELTALVATGADLKPELMEFLLKLNTSYEIGAFGILFDGSIVYKQMIITDKLNEAELLQNLMIVGSVADKYDDIITVNFGGKRACDVSAEI